MNFPCHGPAVPPHLRAPLRRRIRDPLARTCPFPTLASPSATRRRSSWSARAPTCKSLPPPLLPLLQARRDDVPLLLALTAPPGPAHSFAACLGLLHRPTHEAW
ncbi:hypothetical protein ACQJBY_050306 [Aegilops geniculata]